MRAFRRVLRCVVTVALCEFCGVTPVCVCGMGATVGGVAQAEYELELRTLTETVRVNKSGEVPPDAIPPSTKVR